MKKLTIYLINRHYQTYFDTWVSDCKHIDNVHFIQTKQVWSKTDKPIQSGEYVTIPSKSLLICHYNNHANNSKTIVPFFSSIPNDTQVVIFSGDWINKEDVDLDLNKLEATLPGRWRIMYEEGIVDNMQNFLEKWKDISPSFDLTNIPWESLSVPLKSSIKNIKKEEQKMFDITKIETKWLGNTKSLALYQKRRKMWHRLYHCHDLEEFTKAFTEIQYWEKVKYCDELDPLFSELQMAIDKGDLDLFKEKVDKWSTYRSNNDRNISTNNEANSIETDDTIPSFSSQKPEFSVLIVDDSKKFIETAVSALRKRARSCVDYNIKIKWSTYDQNIFKDTFSQVREDGRIQIIVMDWDLKNSINYQQAKEGFTGDQLIEKIKIFRPEIECFIVTGYDSATILKEHDFHYRIFAKSNDANDDSVFDDLYAAIIEKMKKRSQTPFFNALKEYSNRRTSVFHAMPISSGRSLIQSTWAYDFYRFYGENYFLAETSNTLAPLDSLLDPSGSLKKAIDLAGKTFGDTDQTYFVTNGTSSANKIVEQALLKPDDQVLIDRNCHKSHHYGLILCDARPIYLNPEPLSFNGEFTGICKGIATQEILDRLEENPDAKMLVITNTTFDGYMHKPHKIIEAVQDQLRNLYEKSNTELTDIEKKVSEFIFLFDEAWFGFGFMHPRYRKYTAAYAAQKFRSKGKKVRIYATQSTHKTLCAFRQGSMIHAWDYMFHAVEQSFHESIYTHITTSPNYGILASMDVGRMQANLEGYRLVNDMRIFSRNIREIFSTKRNQIPYFFLLDKKDMGISSTDFGLDETRLTFYLSPETGITGNECKRILLDDYNIQHNKSTINTILLMCNVGVNETVASHVVSALSELSETLCRKSTGKRTSTIQSALFEFPVEFYNKNNKIRDYFFRSGKAPDQPLKTISLTEIASKIKSKCQVISANFVTPYPPGFPILVPGQIVYLEIIDFLDQLDLKEIHGMIDGEKLQVWLMQ